MVGTSSQSAADFVARLVLTGTTVAQCTKRQLNGASFEGVGYENKHDGLLAAFQSLDRQRSGVLSSQELRGVVTTACPESNIDEVRSSLPHPDR